MKFKLTRYTLSQFIVFTGTKVLLSGYMEELLNIIKEEIRANGEITFERYVELALYHPLYGYYSSGNAVIGKAGDFYTSSQATGMYGRLMAEAYVKLAEVSGPDFVEMGAGEGLFAGDFLSSLARFYPGWYERCRYFIVETAKAMAQRQKEALKSFTDKVVWTEELDGLPEINGIFFSNELLDALPFHRVRQEPGRLAEIYVGLEGGKLAGLTGILSTPELAMHFNRLMLILPKGTTTEANLRVAGWMGGVAGKLRRGFVVTVDYGYPAKEYYSPARIKGTALCHYKHSVNEDFFERVGEQDITAHVDFTTVGLMGQRAGLSVELFCDQGQFLAETLPWFE
ncbi:MAG: class I SAM-dependent methyltransferase, partial [Nitrospirota bacterium]